MGEYAVFAWLKDHYGAFGMFAGLVLLLGIRYLPAWISNMRERRLASLQRRMQDKAEITKREHDLLERIDRKDAVMEKLTGNHIQHLEVALGKADAFHDAAVEHFRAMTSSLVELRFQVQRVEGKVDSVRDISIEIKGKIQ